MKNQKFSNSIFFCLITIFNLSQNQKFVKEEFDLYSQQIVDLNLEPCSFPILDYENNMGDGMSMVLEAYINMYQATKDKAYLYKFIKYTLCIMQNRFDVTGFFNDPRFSSKTYQNGHILAAFSKFVFLVKKENIELIDLNLHQFDFIINNHFNVNFDTFGSFANWLNLKCYETLTWFLINNYYDEFSGIKTEPDDESPSHINMQVGFARTFLFLGIINFDINQINRAKKIATLYKSKVVFNQCSYNYDLLINFVNNSYFWYHAGWKKTGNQNNCESYNSYIEYYEDISHGSLVLSFVFDFYKHFPNEIFTLDDMVKFRNMFCKNIYDGEGGFHNAVNGFDGPICAGGDDCQPTNPPKNYYKQRALNYMPLQQFDEIDNTATPPNTYDIILEYYNTDISGKTTYPYQGLDSRGHSEIIKTAWDRECYNLTLFNRDVVYDQNFFSKNNLIIHANSDNYLHNLNSNSFADPIITTNDFTIQPNVSVNLIAGESIYIKDDFHAKAGASLHVFNESNICSDGLDGFIKKPTPQKELTSIKINQYTDKDKTKSIIQPNPTKNEFQIETTNLSLEETVYYHVFDTNGKILLKGSTKNKEKISHTLKTGLYFIQVETNSQKSIQKLYVD